MRILFASLLLLAAPAVVTAQQPAGWPEFVRDFDAYVAADGVVGASVIYLRNGSPVVRHDIGFADRAAGTRVGDSSIFHWGSITKTLTAIAIMQLRDRGRLSLDDKMTRYLPELRRVHDPFGRVDSITIRMLLSHTSGFRGGTWPHGSGEPWQPFEPTSWEQLVAMMPYQALLFAPGARYGYSNPGFVYLARIVEQLTGDPWDSYVTKNIFMPLGLTRSYFRGTPYHLAPHRSHHYAVRRDSASGRIVVADGGADFDPGITTPNGGWNAPAGDLARYAAFLTNTAPPGGSREHYETVVKRTTLEEMWRPVAPMAQGYEASATNAIGLSFFVVGSGPRRLVGHTGSQADFRAFLYVNPATTAGVIVVFNTSNHTSPANAAYARLLTSAQALLN